MKGFKGGAFVGKCGVNGVGGNFVTLTDRSARLLDANKTKNRTKKEVG
jgi:hypothetical protein